MSKARNIYVICEVETKTDYWGEKVINPVNVLDVTTNRETARELTAAENRSRGETPRNGYSTPVRYFTLEADEVADFIRNWSDGPSR